MGCCSSDTSGADNQAPLIAASPRRATRYKEVGYNPYGATAVSEADDRGMDHHVGTGAGSSGAAATGAGGPGHHGQQQYQRRSDASSMASMLDDEDGGDDEPQPDRKKSLKKLKTHKKGTRRYVLHQKIRKIFEEKRNRLHEVVKLPQGEDKNEWIAVHVIDFYNDISLLYGEIAAMCTQTSCPIMCAGNHRYLWADGVTFTKPIKVPAKEYVHYLMNWVDNQLSDEDLFPTTQDATFSAEFMPACKIIFKRLFRVYAHLYHHHFKQFVQLGLQQHLNLCFKRFGYFVLEFNMVSRKELEPLSRLITKIEELARQLDAGEGGEHK